MTIDNVFQLLKYRASKAGYSGYISANDFNLLFPAAQIRYFNKLFGNQNEYQVGNPIPRIAYPETLKISTSLAKFGSVPQQLIVDASGRCNKPTDLFYIDSLNHYVLSTGGSSIRTFSFVGGSGYTTGTYTNINLTGGTGVGASATIIVTGGVITSVVINEIGIGFVVNDVLTASIPAGSGFHITILSLTQNIPTPIQRVEKQDLSDWLFSYYQAPTEIFPIYVEYDTYLQFYPQNLATAQLTYLKKPLPAFWSFTLGGSIGLLGTLIGGTGYVNGTYSNVLITGGNGSGALATIVVSTTVVTSVTITSTGFNYRVSDVLSASNTSLGGTGSGFQVPISTITNARQVYNPTGSIDPIWSDTDLDEVIYLVLKDIGINTKDGEMEQFAQQESKSGGI